MGIFRFAEPRGNSPQTSMKRHADVLEGLAADFRSAAGFKTTSSTPNDDLPLVEQWFLDSILVPVVVGNIFHPGRADVNAANFLAFTDPVELLSIELRRVRTSKGWYELGKASPLAERTLEAWSVKGAR